MYATVKQSFPALTVVLLFGSAMTQASHARIAHPRAAHVTGALPWHGGTAVAHPGSAARPAGRGMGMSHSFVPQAHSALAHQGLSGSHMGGRGALVAHPSAVNALSHHSLVTGSSGFVHHFRYGAWASGQRVPFAGAGGLAHQSVGLGGGARPVSFNGMNAWNALRSGGQSTDGNFLSPHDNNPTLRIARGVFAPAGGYGGAILDQAVTRQYGGNRYSGPQAPVFVGNGLSPSENLARFPSGNIPGLPSANLPGLPSASFPGIPIQAPYGPLPVGTGFQNNFFPGMPVGVIGPMTLLPTSYGGLPGFYQGGLGAGLGSGFGYGGGNFLFVGLGNSLPSFGYYPGMGLGGGLGGLGFAPPVSAIGTGLGGFGGGLGGLGGLGY